MLQDGYWECALAAIVPAGLAASWFDFRRNRVPNWLNLTILLGGLTCRTAWQGPSGLVVGLQGMLVGFGLLVLLWAMKGMGAGDVKLMAAIGAWLGPALTLYAVLLGGLAGGLIAVAMIVRRRCWHAAAANVGVLLTKVGSVRTAFSDFGSAASLSKSAGVLPYAIPLTLGSLIVLVSDYSGWWKLQ